MEQSRQLSAWLKQHSTLAILSQAALDALAAQLTERLIPAQRQVALADLPAETLYILQQGRVDLLPSQGFSYAQSLLPGAVLHLQELLLNQPIQQTARTLTECRFWVLPKLGFQEWLDRYPEVTMAFSRQLAAEVVELTARLTYEQERQAQLRPYLVPRVKRGIVGKSRYAMTLRQQIKAAAGDERPVLIFGEPGLEKDNLCALIHFGSQRRRNPLILLESARLKVSELFGQADGHLGLLDWLGEGTLILNNIHDLSPELLNRVKHLLETGKYCPVNLPGQPLATSRISPARILFTSEKVIPGLESLVGHTIKVSPLRVRKTDLAAQVDYYLSQFTQNEGLRRPKVTPEALRRLQGYDFPGNLRELKILVERAVVQSAGSPLLTEEIFWPAQAKKKQFRVNLLNAWPGLRGLLTSPWWPDRINYGFTSWFFALIVGILFFGPQSRDHNAVLNLFWCWWWPLILVLFPLVGRMWCAVCPFMIYGEIVQKLSLWLWPRQLQRWPRQQTELWGGWFLFGLFAVIFLWEELWDLPNTAYLSAWLLLLITGGAMVCSVIFERRYWCRYLCPIGGMNGLFAKMAVIELRAQQGICSATCTTYACYKGGPALGEGQATGGCPVYSHPAQLEDNRDCVLCMTCLKACPHRSVELNLRPPGIELWTTHKPRLDEVALLLLLLGGIYLHRLPEIVRIWGLSAVMTNFWAHSLLSVVVLLLPAGFLGLMYGVLKVVQPWLAKGSCRLPSFVKLTYGYLPLVWGASLAYYLKMGLGEAGQLLAVTQRTFGLLGDWPVLIAHPAVIVFLQGTTLLAAVLLSMFLTQKIARQPLRFIFAQHFATVMVGASLWYLTVVF